MSNTTIQVMGDRSVPQREEESRMSMGERLGRAFDRLLDWLALACCGLVMFQVISVSAEVLIRQFFGFSYGWVTSLNEWSLVLMTFAGTAWLQREGGHTSDDSIVGLFPVPVQTFAHYVGWLLAIATCLVLTWYGAKLTWENYVDGTYDFFKLREVPVFYIYAAIPFGSFLWLIQILRGIRRELIEGRTPQEQTLSDM
ncbi:TRAP transporter small permease subunit [Paracoccus sp. S-4012]|uniref:TRAP transporter small permease n=1 Tax=Paracoccus sp. S-4012 TaxID=2665648 RepID=UPI0012AFCEAF|nr:TRAP transporter small permease [Paracoccus sp. S-4012]MRX52011.1 TRAP transporter small permease subunit [Paracoccus sp. S-4012]